MLKEDSEKINVYKREDFWWRNGFDSKTYLALQVVSGKGRGLWAQLSPSEKSTLYEAIGYAGDSVTLEKPKQYIGISLLNNKYLYIIRECYAFSL